VTDRRLLWALRGTAVVLLLSSFVKPIPLEIEFVLVAGLVLDSWWMLAKWLTPVES
jgi:hypothetical protein